MEEDLKHLITCIICKEIVIDEIYQCKTGHLYCQTCIGKISKCALCSVTIDSPIRCLPVEQLRDHLELQCKNEECKITTQQFKKHKKECKFNKCICEFQGTENELKQHIPICPLRKVKCLFRNGCDSILTKEAMRLHLETEHKLVTCDTELNICSILRVPEQINHTSTYTLILPNKDVVMITLLRQASNITITLTSFMTQLYDIRIKYYNKDNFICRWIEEREQETEMRISHTIWKDCFGQNGLDLSADIFIKLSSELEK
jgi:hypothetical protein